MLTFESEEDFNALCVRLSIECVSWLSIGACLLPPVAKKWNRNEAILGGLLTRCCKLSQSLLDQTCQHRRETTFIFGRLVFESLVNIQYLVHKNDPVVFNAYVIDSLLHEKKLMADIKSNIENRNGQELAIETRMLRSIGRTFARSGIAVEEVTRKAATPWKGVNFYDRLTELGISQVYLGLFGGPSHSIHGSWQDLLEYHLTDDKDGFTPNLDWHNPRPQVLLAIAKFQVHTLQIYFCYLDVENVFETQLDDLWSRIRLVDEAHERFLSHGPGLSNVLASAKP